MKKSLLTILIVGLFAMGAQATVTLTLIPSSGTVSGEPGDTVGWGFTITNDSTTDWLVLTGSEYDVTGGPPFEGSYLDYWSLPSAPLLVIGPAPESSSAMQTFDAGLQTGLGEFDIFSTADPGTVTGNLVVHYALFSQDPNDSSFDPNSVIDPDATVSAAANVHVPEPGSAMMLLAAAPLLAGSLRRRFVL